MAIPESQLDTWSKLGSKVQSASTYQTIKAVLESINAPYSGKDYNVFLQGSYGNDTNVYSESDVDIVIVLNDAFSHDLGQLADLRPEQRAQFDAKYPDATYDHTAFKKDVTAWLKKNYSSVEPGAKALFIESNNSRRNADVIVSTKYRRYHRFTGVTDELYDEGICFYASGETKIVNFPKQHSANCTTKHQATNNWFKPLVRIFKNMRNRMMAENIIDAGLAPSYYIEELLYNVPAAKFGGNYFDTFVNSVNWLLQADRSKFVCANEQYYLFHPSSPVTWRADKCKEFLDATANFWSNW